MREVVGVIHVVRPLLSVVRILPFHSDQFTRVNNPVIFTVPFTSSLYPGVLVPIPTFPVDPTLILLFPLPSAMMMLLERFPARPVTLAPRIVLPEPVVIPPAVLAPIAVLLSPLTLSTRAATPSAVLFDPDVFAERESTPLAVLFDPVEFV
jgi:hypothetical protein